MDVTIDCYRVRGKGDTLHNKQDKFGRETKLAEKARKKCPLYRVKCFFKINFQQASGRGALPTILAKELLNNINVVAHKPATKKGILHRADNFLQSLGKSASKNHGHHFVDNITAGNGSEIRWRGDIL
jgi:hypothetical protein